MSKRAKTAAAPSPTQPPTQLFSGLSLFCLNLPPKVAELQQGLVSRRGGTLTVLTADVKERLAAAPPAEELLVLCESGGSRLDDLRAWAAKAGLPLRVCTYDWVGKSIQLGALQRTEAFEVRPLPAPLAEEEEKNEPLPLQPPREGECSDCRKQLPPNCLHTCQQCLTGKPANRRALFLLYPESPLPANAGLLELFKELKDFKEAQADTPKENDVETQGFACAVSMLRAAWFQITSSSEAARLLPFLGDGKVADYIDEYLGNVGTKYDGTVERLRECRAKPELVARRLFRKIPYMGRQTSAAWVQQGHRSMGDLQTALKAGTLGKLSVVAQTLISSCDDFASHMPASECEPILAVVQNALRPRCPDMQVFLGGGVARGAKTCHDIDILVSHENPTMALLREYLGLIEATPGVQLVTGSISGTDGGVESIIKEWIHISASETKVGSENIDQSVKAFCLIKLGECPWRRFDLVLVPMHQWAFQQLGWSGSRQFLRWLRLGDAATSGRRAAAPLQPLPLCGRAGREGGGGADPQRRARARRREAPRR